MKSKNWDPFLRVIVGDNKVAQPDGPEQLEHLRQRGGVEHGGRGRVHHRAQVQRVRALRGAHLDLRDVWVARIRKSEQNTLLT